MMDEPGRMPLWRDKERLSTIERFLTPTLPKGRDEWYNKIRPIQGKELSLGILDKTDILSHLKQAQAARIFYRHGQEVGARGVMSDFVAELKLSGSIDGTTLSNIFRDKIEYEQTQHVHEHIDQPKKRSFLGGR